MVKKSLLQWILVTACLVGLAGFMACTTKHEAGPVSLAYLNVNGPGIDGVVSAKTSQFYTLYGITEGQQYTLRTMISTTTLDGGATYVPDGTLTITVYRSESAYKNNEAYEFIIDTGFMTSSASAVYEYSFPAYSSGDYVAVITGASLSVPDIQLFYDFRLMSGEDSYLSSFSTTTLPVYTTGSIDSGYLQIFNANTLELPASYSINITSDQSSTSENPQVFLYADKTLTLDKLLVSSIPTTTYYLIYQFRNGVQVSSSPSVSADSNTILSSLLTDPSSTAPVPIPYIVIKGVASSASYTLTVSQ